jgi:hypothetical protein
MKFINRDYAAALAAAVQNGFGTMWSPWSKTRIGELSREYFPSLTLDYLYGLILVILDPWMPIPPIKPFWLKIKA